MTRSYRLLDYALFCYAQEEVCVCMGSIMCIQGFDTESFAGSGGRRILDKRWSVYTHSSLQMGFKQIISRVLFKAFLQWIL